MPSCTEDYHDLEEQDKREKRKPTYGLTVINRDIKESRKLKNNLWTTESYY